MTDVKNTIKLDKYFALIFFKIIICLNIEFDKKKYKLVALNSFQIMLFHEKFIFAQIIFFWFL